LGPQLELLDLRLALVDSEVLLRFLQERARVNASDVSAPSGHCC